MSPKEVRLVLDHARPYSVHEWANYFHVHPQTIETWRAKGMLLGLWSGPDGQRWNTVRAEAVRCLWDGINALERSYRH